MPAGTGGKDKPVIVDWTLKPIWEMQVPGFTMNAKKAMKKTFQDVMKASVKCAEENCSGRGACAPRDSKWTNISSVKNLEDLFDPSKCFCIDGVEGAKCNRQPDMALTQKSTPTFVNVWDGYFAFRPKKALSGVASVHWNFVEDRAFKFKTTEPVDARIANLVDEKITGIQNVFDHNSYVHCDTKNGYFMTGVDSAHHNHFEDRTFVYRCGRYDPVEWTIEQETCQAEGEGWTNFVNWFDNPFDFNCETTAGSGYVLVGMQSYHHNSFEDRRFKFKCCKLDRAPLPPRELA